MPERATAPSKRFFVTPAYIRAETLRIARLVADNPQGLTSSQIAAQQAYPASRCADLLAAARKGGLLALLGGSGANKLWTLPDRADALRKKRKAIADKNRRARDKLRLKLWRQKTKPLPSDELPDNQPFLRVIISAGTVPPPVTHAPRCVFEWRP